MLAGAERPSAQRRRAFRNASWLVIALLVVSYTLQLAKPHEQQSAYATQQRLVRFVSEAQQSEEMSRAGGVPRVERAQRLFHRFGGLFAAWACRFWENRAFERAYLQHHFGSLSLAATAAFNMALGASLLLFAMATAVSALRASIGPRLARMLAPPAELSVSVLANPCDSEGAPLLGGAGVGETTPSRSLSRTERPRTRLGRLARRCSPRFYHFYCCAAWPASTAPREPNRVCNTKALAVKLPLRPWLVCLLKFLASLLVYFSQPDDFFFLFVAFGQIVETGSFRSCGPVSFFCFMFCALEALAAYNQAKHDTELNERSCVVVRPDGSSDLVPWSHVRRGDVVRLANHDSPPCDLLVLRVRGGLRVREKDLTGESKPVNKQVAETVQASLGGMDGPGRPTCGLRVETERGQDAVRLDGTGHVLDASYQLFRGTTVLLSRVGGARPFVEGVAVRLGHECKMYRECRLAAAQPPSVLLERMSSIGMLLVLLLVGFTYDNTLAIFATGVANGASFGKVFFGNLIYENTMVPMSLKQLIMISCSLQAAWYAELSVDVNVWQAVARLGELATESTSAAILTDKTGTLTLNRMTTEVVARRLQPTDGCRTWAIFSDRHPASAPPTLAVLGGRAGGGGGDAVGISGAGAPPAACGADAGRGAGAAACPRGSPMGGRRSCSAVGAAGNSTVELLSPVPFPQGAEAVTGPMGDACLTWAATTGELPGDEVGEAEEASFLERVPGRLLRNLTNGGGGAEVVMTLPAPVANGGGRGACGLSRDSGGCGAAAPAWGESSGAIGGHAGDCVLDMDSLSRAGATAGRRALDRAMHKPAGAGGVNDLLLPAPGVVCAHRVRIRLQLPLDLRLRAKGALVAGQGIGAARTRLDQQEMDALLLALRCPHTPPATPGDAPTAARPAAPGSGAAVAGSAEAGGGTAAGGSASGGIGYLGRGMVGSPPGVWVAEPAGFTLVAQGAGSFFKAMHPPNAVAIDLLEGGSTTGVLLRHFEWRGSVRIWWHGERHVSEEEGQRLISDLREATSAEARAQVMARAYRGLVVTQASAMEDPYQDDVPESIAALRAEGYRIMMVTGDSESAAENIAYATGLAVRGGDEPRPLVRVQADSPAELLEVLRMLRPAARLGEFCYLFGSATTAVLQRVAERLDIEDQRRTSDGIGCDAARRVLARVLPAAAARALRRLPGCADMCAPPSALSAEPAEHVLAASVVEAMVELLTSGAHTVVWAQISVDQKPFVAWFVQRHVRLMALAIGDGVNDVGMIRASHVSMGIRGTESHLAAQAASFRASEWRQVRPLLLSHAVRSMVLLSTTMKWVYYKHAMTACALEAWMVHNHYSSWRDPTDPIYMIFWNGAVFLSALAYAVEDSIVDPQTVRHKNLFSAWAIVRWWLTGALHGFLITFALVLAFEAQPPRELGVRFMCVSSVVLSARLAFITNHWLSWEDVAAADGAPLLVRWTLRALHTKAGHWVPCFFFTYCQTRWSGIATIPVVLLAVGVAAICVLTDCLIFPRWGPFRYTIESACALMLSPSRRILQRVGGGKPPVELQKISAKKQ